MIILSFFLMILGKINKRREGVNEKGFFRSILRYQCFLFDFWACLFNICILIIQPDTCKHIYIIAFLSAVCILICMPEHTSTLKTKRTLFCSGIALMVMYSLTIKVSPSNKRFLCHLSRTMCVSQCFLNALIVFLKSWVIKCAPFKEFHTFDKPITIL